MIKPGDYVSVVDGIFKGEIGVILEEYERQFDGERIWELQTRCGDTVLVRESRLEVLP